jgi:hypothetical protein
LTSPEIRHEVVDLLCDEITEHDFAPTPGQRALLDSATDAERHARTEILNARFDSTYRWVTGQATPEEAELHEMTWTLPAIYEGLPASVGFVLLVHFRWPDWDQEIRDLARPVFAEWSPQDRAILEERFALMLEGKGFHWDL